MLVPLYQRATCNIKIQTVYERNTRKRTIKSTRGSLRSYCARAYLCSAKAKKCKTDVTTRGGPEHATSHARGLLVSAKPIAACPYICGPNTNPVRGGSPLTPFISVQYLRYIPQGRRFGAREWAWDLLSSRSKTILRKSYALVWSEVSMVVEVLTQRSRCEGTDPLHYANAAPVPVRPHN